MLQLKRKLHKILITFLFLALSLPGMSTHYMGGDITYQFLGIFGGQYRYKIQADVYINRLPPSNFPSGNVNLVRIGIYDAATDLQVQCVDLTPYLQVTVFPDLPPGCSVPSLNANLSAKLNRCSVDVDLPGPFSDHYIIHERGTRDGNINNLQGPVNAGNTFVSEMAPNFVQNSSPQFQDIAIPFLCTNDTTTFSNNAVDPDGDFLVYSFVQTFDQVTGPGPEPPCPASFNLNTIPIVPYANTTYTLSQPFGTGSYASINAANGLTKYYAPTSGKFTVVVRIQEYRDINGDGIQDLIGVTYRELFFIAQPCAPNPTPTVSPISVNGTTLPIVGGTTNIDIFEGESLTFTFNATDANNDSVSMIPTGDIINGTNGYTGPLATFPSNTGQGSASSTFNWQSACGFTGQYLVRVNVKDNGCPPKDDIFFFAINVRPFKAADEVNITDPVLNADSVCLTTDTLSYFVNSNNGATVTWQVNGGNIIGGTSSDTIQVQWNTVGINQLILIETSTLACSDTSVFDVKSIAADTIVASSDFSICEGDSVQLTASGSNNYQWSPNISIDNPFSTTPFVFPVNTISYIVNNPGGGSCAISDTVTITVVNDFADAGTNTALCANDTIQLGISPIADKVYVWDSQDFLNDSSIANPDYYAINTGSLAIIDTLLLFVQDTINGCLFTDEVIVTVNPLPVANAGLVDTICSKESTNIGSPAFPSTTCTWTGNFIGNPNSCLTTVTPQNFGSTNVTYQYILLVSNGTTNCINRDTVEIVSKPLPFVNAGLDTTICRFQQIQLGGSPSAGIIYSWVTNSGTSPISPTGSSNPVQTLNSVGNFQSIVTAININPNNLCTNRDTINISVRALPAVNIIPDTIICSEDSIIIGNTPSSNFTYTWNTQDNLNDSTTLNAVLAIDNPSQTSQFFTYQLVVQNNNTLCIDSADFNVEVKPLPIVEAGPTLIICSESNGIIGVPSTPGYVYTWNTSLNLDDSTLAQPEVTLITGPNPDSILYTLNVEWNGCFDNDSTYVRVNPKPVVDTILGGISICPNLEDVLYVVLDTIGFANFQWGISGGLIISPPNNDSIFVDWGGLNPNASLFMIPTNDFNCIGDTTFLDIDINPILSSPPPIGPSSVCLGDASSLIYAVPFTSGYTYNWSNPSVNHNQFPIPPGNQVAFTFTDTGTALIFVEQEVTTVTNTCLGFSDTLIVVIHPDPNLSIPILGDTSICENTDSVIYTLNGFPNSSYQWSVFPGGTINDTSNSISLNWDSLGNFQVVAFETTQFGCTSGDVSLDIQINPIPETQFAALDTFICTGSVEGKSYSVTGFNNSKYVWSVIDGNLQVDDSAATVLVNWVSGQNNAISVFEISEFNCIGDLIEFTPQSDFSLPLVSNVTLSDPADTFSTVLIDYSKGEFNTDLIPDSLTIFRKIATEATWTPLGQISSSDSSYLDADKLNRWSNFYEYQISSINSCADEIFSPLHNTIKLEGNGVESLDQLNLVWNEYLNWLNEVGDYEIYRRVDEEENFTLISSTSNASYTDFSANDGFDHYFRIRAIENGGENESWSNEFLVEFENLPLVSNVITANADGYNDTWLIDNLELYPNTKVTIYNRYNTEVYKSDDYKGDWDAENLPSGTYFFQAILKEGEEPIRGYIQLLR